VLSLYSSNKEAYTEEHERIIEVIARQVSPVIFEAHAAERVRSRSLTDENTGLPNLRYFFELVNSHLAQPDHQHPFSLVAVRWTGGSIATNDQIVLAVRRALRPADLLFSSGADELLVLLLNTDHNAGSALANRIAANLEALRAAGTLAQAKLGLACAPFEAHTGDALLALARERSSANGPPRNEAIH
jgi:GGDEF domain-containing protein